MLKHPAILILAVGVFAAIILSFPEYLRRVFSRIKSGSPIVVTPSLVDLGECKPGQVEAAVDVRNDSKSPVKVWGFKSTCNCVFPLDELPLPIPPGESRSLRFRIKVGSFPTQKPIVQTIQMYAGGNELLTIEIPVQWSVKE